MNTICNPENLLDKCILAFGENRKNYPSLVNKNWHNFRYGGLAFLLDDWPEKHQPIMFCKLKEKSREEIQKERRKKAFDELIEKMNKKQLIEIVKHQVEIIEHEEKKKSKANKFEKIKELKESNSKLSIKILCMNLGVSESGYHKYHNNKNNPDRIDNRERDDKVKLLNRTMEIFIESGGVYGITKTYKQLEEEGYKISRPTLIRYRRILGIKSPIRSSEKKINREDPKDTSVDIQNLLNRNFQPGFDNRTICTDITYIKYRGEFLYLSAAISLINYQIIGYSISANPNTELVMETFKDINLNNFDMIHSDHGLVYSSNDFKKLLDDNSIRQSMSRIGNSLDNRPIEYWFSNLKEEKLRLINIDKLEYEELLDEIKKYIFWYNHSRIQKILGWQSPLKYRQI
ncbi:IS3 family transposase [Mycoplasmopsis agassizii]|uniref:IS3 family transposase n=3 Tax=Mycoplasmopsis agassizii TaxID=33922 RepID=UPI0035293BDC